MEEPYVPNVGEGLTSALRLQLLNKEGAHAGHRLSLGWPVLCSETRKNNSLMFLPEEPQNLPTVPVP